MKTSKILALLLLPTWLFVACGGDDSSKTQCNSDNDCLAEYSCNLARTDDGSLAESGQCMTIGNTGSFLCGTDNPCPAGQWCFNGLCAPGCMTDLDCADNQYCDTQIDLPNNQFGTHMCVNKEVSTCSTDADCETTQECILGMCSVSAGPQECTPRIDAPDGCDDFSICLDVGDGEVEEFECYAFPPCPQDGICPVGLYGSVCNEDIFPAKERICLTSLCKEEAHCPSTHQCIPLQGEIGGCSDGAFGSLCLDDQDCKSELTCMTAAPGMVGTCMSGTQLDGCEDAGGTCIDAMSECPSGTNFSAETCTDMMELCCK